MIDFMVIVKVAGLFIAVTGVIIFFLHRTLVTSTEGAVKRLNDEIAIAQKKQAELNQKVREADEELAKRKAEAMALADKMRSEAEKESREEREKIINAARKEGEEIIAKAQGAAEKLKVQLVNTIDAKAVDFGMQLLNVVLNEKVRAAVDKELVGEFLQSFRSIDMSKVSPEVTEIEIVCLNQIDEVTKNEIAQLIKQKLNRAITVKTSTDSNIGGGVIIKFGSIAIDGSVRNLLRDRAKEMKQKFQNV